MLPFIQSSYLSALLESFSSGVLIMNIRGDVYAANDTAGLLLGFSRPELLSGHFHGQIVVRFQDPGDVEALFEQARTHDAATSALQTVYHHPTLGPRHYTFSLSRLVEYGKIFGIVAQITDVTPIYEMHQREKAMLESQSALQRERIESLDQLSMAIAHQIRNPLMSIAGFARILERKCRLDETGTQCVRTILDGAGRLEDIVRAVTQYTASRPVNSVQTDAGDLAREALEALGPLPGGVRVALEGPWPQGLLDPDLTRDALVEVLRNAAEACETQGEVVRVSAIREGAGLRIAVRDQGPGIPEAALPFLFDPFYTTKAVGVGMGLAKARRWMRDQGGDVAVTSPPGGGVLAVLSVPEPSILKGVKK